MKTPMFTVTRSGIKDFGDEPVLYRWWVIPSAQVDTFVYDFGDDWKSEFLAELSEQIPELDPYGHYSGPGQPFSNRPSVWRTRTRVLVTQRCGLDV